MQQNSSFRPFLPALSAGRIRPRPTSAAQLRARPLVISCASAVRMQTWLSGTGRQKAYKTCLCSRFHPVSCRPRAIQSWLLAQPVASGSWSQQSCWRWETDLHVLHFSPGHLTHSIATCFSAARVQGQGAGQERAEGSRAARRAAQPRGAHRRAPPRSVLCRHGASAAACVLYGVMPPPGNRQHRWATCEHSHLRSRSTAGRDSRLEGGWRPAG
jgi:hypothetical protein